MTAKFKAIIVGGGPTGLIMAHALARANIDWVLIERRDTVPFRTGAALLLLPQGVRILDQLGILQQAQQIGSKLGNFIHTDSYGDVIRDVPFFDTLAESHGYDSLMFNRQDYLQMLVESLPECDERVKIGRQVTGVETTASGVSVRFEDGTSETGSIVIGADGIWSVVRRELERLSGDKIFEPEYTGYSGIYGHGGAVEGLMPWTGHERHDYGEDGFGIQVFTTPTKTFFGSFRRIPVSKDESGNDGTFKRYTEADADAFAKSLLDVPLYKGVKFGDIWKEKELYGMTQIHSGMAKQWHWSRLVLVGDSAHKVTPNIGAGAAVGVESAASLANHLHALLQRTSQPDAESLSEAFAAYQAERMGMSKVWVNIARSHLDTIIWRSWLHRIQCFTIPGLIGTMRILNKFSVALVSRAIRLDYVAFDERSGTVPWKFPPVKKPPAKRAAYGRWFMIPATLCAIAAMAFVWTR